MTAAQGNDSIGYVFVGDTAVSRLIGDGIDVHDGGIWNGYSGIRFVVPSSDPCTLRLMSAVLPEDDIDHPLWKQKVEESTLRDITRSPHSPWSGDLSRIKAS